MIPVPFKDADTKSIFAAYSATAKILSEAGFHVEEDLRELFTWLEILSLGNERRPFED